MGKFNDYMQFTLESALQTVYERQQKGHPLFYRALPQEASKIVREYYRRQLSIPEINVEEVVLKNDCGTLISTGYKRVVIGDYGAYIEFTERQVEKKNISTKWQGPQNSSASYIWYQTNDASQTKIYLQQRRVQYADYIPGMYYVSPEDVFVERILTAECMNWRLFARIASPQHLLEAKRASGGEVIGNPINKLFAKEGQWICRNPENGHTWICHDQNFGSLYRPMFVEKTQHQTKKKIRKPKNEQKPTNRKKLNAAESNNAVSEADLGPLFTAETGENNDVKQSE